MKHRLTILIYLNIFLVLTLFYTSFEHIAYYIKTFQSSLLAQRPLKGDNVGAFREDIVKILKREGIEDFIYSGERTITIRIHSIKKLVSLSPLIKEFQSVLNSNPEDRFVEILFKTDKTLKIQRLTLYKNHNSTLQE